MHFLMCWLKAFALVAGVAVAAGIVIGFLILCDNTYDHLEDRFGGKIALAFAWTLICLACVTLLAFICYAGTSS